MVATLLIAALDPSTEAIGTVQKALVRFDVAGPYRDVKAGPWQPDGRLVTLIARNGHKFTGLVRPDGHLWAVERDDSRTAVAHKRPTAADVALALRWLTKWKPKFATRLLPLGSYTFGLRYEAVIDGYSFIESPYGYDFTILNGQFGAFNAREVLPRFGPNAPKLTRADALRKGLAYFEDKKRQGVVGYQTSVVGLAWIDQAAGNARLVWRILGQPKLGTLSRLKTPRSYEVYFDAIDGTELLPYRR